MESFTQAGLSLMESNIIFYQAGDMATGKMTIGNGEYYFDENGDFAVRFCDSAGAIII